MAVLEFFINAITKLLKYKSCTCPKYAMLTHYVALIFVTQFKQFKNQKKRNSSKKKLRIDNDLSINVTITQPRIQRLSIYLDETRRIIYRSEEKR